MCCYPQKLYIHWNRVLHRDHAFFCFGMRERNRQLEFSCPEFGTWSFTIGQHARNKEEWARLNLVIVGNRRACGQLLYFAWGVSWCCVSDMLRFQNCTFNWAVGLEENKKMWKYGEPHMSTITPNTRKMFLSLSFTQFIKRQGWIWFCVEPWPLAGSCVKEGNEARRHVALGFPLCLSFFEHYYYVERGEVFGAV